MHELFCTLDELGARVALALAVDYAGPPNGRVRDLPDLRTIRYYTTLGLIDRPAAMRGRTALYGVRHLQQLVAIKRLQTRGLSLAEIQRHMLDLSASALARLAKLPKEEVVDDEPIPQINPVLSNRDETFWRTPSKGTPPSTATPETQTDMTLQLNTPLQGVSLSAETTLLFAPTRPLDDADCAALRQAAMPLLKLLHKRRLLTPRHERNP